MKNLNSLFLLFIMVGSSAFGATIEELNALYDRRAVDTYGFENARLAVKQGIETGLNNKENLPK